MSTRAKTLILLDVDGTLTEPRKLVKDNMVTFMKQVRELATLGIVGGSDIGKISEQMGGVSVLEKYDYVFAENGLVAHKDGQLFHRQDIATHIGNDQLQTLINFCLKYMSELRLPVKRGTFIEFRSGLINICPVGRSCSQAERDEFAEYDRTHGIRQKFRQALVEQFAEAGLKFVIGGQISIDAFPVGWDKTYCLQFVEQQKFDTIHFFGDKTKEGGNDYEIFADPRTIGHTVTGPEDTITQIKEICKIE